MLPHPQQAGEPDTEEKGQSNMRQKYKIAVTKIDPEAEELKALNEEIRKNRERRASQQLLERYRQMFWAVSQHIKEDEAAAQAEEQRMKHMERRYHRHMRRLAHRIFFCFLITLGVCLCWLASLVRLEFLLMVGFVCA